MDNATKKALDELIVGALLALMISVPGILFALAYFWARNDFDSRYDRPSITHFVGLILLASVCFINAYGRHRADVEEAFADSNWKDDEKLAGWQNETLRRLRIDNHNSFPLIAIWCLLAFGLYGLAIDRNILVALHDFTRIY